MSEQGAASVATRTDAPKPHLAAVRPRPTRFGRARDVTSVLVHRDLISRYRRTFLGVVWSMVTPALALGTYYFIFVVIARASPVNDVPRADGATVHIAIYMFCGLTIWSLFANSLAAATPSVMKAGYMLQRMSFPRSALPLTAVASSLVTFVAELAVLAVLVIVLVGPPSLHLLWLPPVLAVAIVLAAGFGLLLAAGAVFMRDLGELVGVSLRLWMLATPVVFSLDILADRPLLSQVIKANPMTGVVVGYRNAVLLNRPPDLNLLLYSAAVSSVIFAVGWYVFHRCQRYFPELT